MSSMITRLDEHGNELHQPARGYDLMCVCGFKAQDEADLEEHGRNA